MFFRVTVELHEKKRLCGKERKMDGWRERRNKVFKTTRFFALLPKKVVSACDTPQGKKQIGSPSA